MAQAEGGIGQAAAELLEEMKRAQADMQQQQETQKVGGPNEMFQQAMQQSDAAAANVPQAQQVAAASQAHNVLLQARLQNVTPTTHVGQAASTERSKLINLVDGLLQGQDKMTEIIDMALSGRQFSPPELLVMQAGIFRFSQELELTGKVIEKATGSVKQTLNTNV